MPGGKHWIFKYDPVKLGYVIAQQQGFLYKGIKCGDIKGENGLIYTAPSRYRDINGEEKEYEVENEMAIAMAPDMLFELIKFTKYEKPEDRGVKIQTSKKVRESEARLPVIPVVSADVASDSGFSSGGKVEEARQAGRSTSCCGRFI